MTFTPKMKELAELYERADLVNMLIAAENSIVNYSRSNFPSEYHWKCYLNREADARNRIKVLKGAIEYREKIEKYREKYSGASEEAIRGLINFI